MTAIENTGNEDSNYFIDMPDIGEGIAEVEIVEWPVTIGDIIKEDDVICVVMTDKATVEIPSPVDGQITWLATQAGEVLAVGAQLVGLHLSNEEKTLNQPTHNTDRNDDVQTETVPTASIDNNNTTSTHGASTQDSTPEFTSNNPNNSSIDIVGMPRPEGEKAIAAPAVRQRARNAGIELQFVPGTGTANRITHADLDQYIASKSSAYPQALSNSTSPENKAKNSSANNQSLKGSDPDTSVEAIKIIGLRRKIASIIQDTMQRIPHFTYVEEVDVTELESLRRKLNRERLENQPKLTLLPFIIRAIVKGIKNYPEMSSRYDDQKNIVHRYAATHIGIATQTDNGLLVPVMKHAETLNRWQSATEIKRLSTAARDGTASRDELSGSTITITSLGSMGGIVTTPIINSPEVAIIGINKIAKRPVWIDGGFIPRDIMNISSSFDHRIIDGFEATSFIQQIKGFLENPATLFMED